MGVTDLWQLLKPVGQPVPLETLENKILAVDVSIWLHQAVKGFRDAQGQSIQNAHLLGLFHRICKLLHSKIKPIFVFDGVPPLLKRQTLASRRERKRKAMDESRDTNKQILANFINRHLVQEKMGQPGSSTSRQKTNKTAEKDCNIFKLPPMPEQIAEHSSLNEEENNIWQDGFLEAEFQNPNEIDIDSEDFQSLPPEVRHEILLSMKEHRKRTWRHVSEMPKQSEDFSQYQMTRLLGRRKLQKNIEETKKELSEKRAQEFLLDMYEDPLSSDFQKIASDDSSHYVFITGLGKRRSEQETDQPLAQEVVQSAELINLGGTRTCVTKSVDKFSIINNRVISDGGKCTTEYFESTKSPEIIDLEENEIKTCIVESVNSQTVDFGTISDHEKHATEDTKLTRSPEIVELEDEILVLEVKERKEKTESQITRNNESSNSVMLPDGGTKTGTEDGNKMEFSKNVILTGPKDQLVQEKKTISAHNSERKTDVVKTILPGTATDIIEVSKNDKTLTATKDKESIFVHNSQKTTGSEAAKAEFQETAPSDVFISDDLGPKNLHEIEPTKGPTLGEPSLVQERDGPQFVNPGAAKPVLPDIEVTVVPSSVAAHDDLFPAEVFLPSEEPAEPTSLIDVNNIQNLEELDQELEQEERHLLQERGRLERQAASVTDQMHQEAQELLKLFGIPFVASPAEAEAQCAQLEAMGLSQGTITDDSDIWPFGGLVVYKNFFTQGKYVEAYDCKNITSEFGMNQERFACFALLTGSDYTEGLQNVGHVTAMEILSEFPGGGIEPLQKFRDWWDAVQGHERPAGTKTRSKLRKIELTPGFPNHIVYDAYLNPEVDRSEERFSWGLPDLQTLREFVEEKFGWTRKKIDDMLLPIVKRVAERQSQTRLDGFVKIGLKRERDLFPSKRLKKAVRRINSKSVIPEPDLSESSSSDPDDPEPCNPTTKYSPTRSRKRKGILK